MNEISQRLKSLRLEAQMSQEDLAAKLNVSRQSVSKWETGESVPDILKLRQLSQLFNVSIDYLVGNEAFIPKDKDEDSHQKALKKRTMQGILWSVAFLISMFGYEVLKEEGWLIAIFVAIPISFWINYYVDK
ncbi:helix-turn-helix domain-containing protein [Lactobacillus psittaci]|uniref:Transcriptional regulator, XRE family n=1 Tax=Lactobacillus psittaci DSM 15354 TaxID=1122152 RepID=A0A0R1RXY9_9LACO|nr:helix-turn-helix domain-containing protein [Lactobacillus psittaci]KRL61847.1 transcriptional regulator, XRE family [Lactobacillus psittaci DSM 15354]